MHSLKGSYTVEGSFIFGISIIIIGTTLMWGFDLYRGSVDKIENIRIEEFDATKTFRIANAGRELVDR